MCTCVHILVVPVNILYCEPQAMEIAQQGKKTGKVALTLVGTGWLCDDIILDFLYFNIFLSNLRYISAKVIHLRQRESGRKEGREKERGREGERERKGGRGRWRGRKSE